MPPIDELIRAFVTLFVIIDPIGTVPIYLSLAGSFALKAQRSIILWALFFMSTILFSTALFGNALLERLSISRDAFAIAGGIFLFWTAFEMLFEKREKRKRKATISQNWSKTELRAIAITPLTIPLLAGPGTISATIILSSNTSSLSDKLYLMLVIAIVISVAGFLLFMGSLLSKYIDDTFRIFISRVMGLILGALAVQMIINAITAVVTS